MNHSFDVIALSETWLNPTNSDIVGFREYKHISNYRNFKLGGGVSLLLKEILIIEKLINSLSQMKRWNVFLLNQNEWEKNCYWLCVQTTKF